jgi:hypothetical protein
MRGALGLLLTASCAVFGVRDTEEPSYQVLRSEGDFEVRQYEPHIIAKTLVEGDYDSITKEGFDRLAGYIFGGNQSKTKIAMTAPVTQAPGEKIAMTAPVTQSQRAPEQWEMTFTMPAGYSLETLPTPLDSRVILEEAPGKTVAVYRFSGRFSDGAFAKNTEKLTAWIDESGYQALSIARLAGYDPPWTLPFLRRNEIMIEIAPTSP